MRSLILLLIIILVSACAHVGQKTTTPAYLLLDQHKIHNGWTITQSAGKYSDEETALYTQVFLDLWQKESFPQGNFKCIIAFDTMEIHWQDEVFTYAKPADGGTRLLGLTYHNLKPKKILVFVATIPHKKPLSIEESVYGHELIHVALGAITGDAQRLHLQDEKATDWPPDYENFLIKVAKEYRKRVDENKRSNSATAKD